MAVSSIATKINVNGGSGTGIIHPLQVPAAELAMMAIAPSAKSPNILSQLMKKSTWWLNNMASYSKQHVNKTMHLSRAEVRKFEEEIYDCMKWWQKLIYLFKDKKIKRRYYL